MLNRKPNILKFLFLKKVGSFCIASHIFRAKTTVYLEYQQLELSFSIAKASHIFPTKITVYLEYQQLELSFSIAKASHIFRTKITVYLEYQQLELSFSIAKASHIFIPPAKRSFRGVYCFQSVRNSVILKFRDSVHISRFLMYNLSSFCPILFKFSTHFNH